jgi:hypothetical protein
MRCSQERALHPALLGSSKDVAKLDRQVTAGECSSVMLQPPSPTNLAHAKLVRRPGVWA